MSHRPDSSNASDRLTGRQEIARVAATRTSRIRSAVTFFLAKIGSYNRYSVPRAFGQKVAQTTDAAQSSPAFKPAPHVTSYSVACADARAQQGETSPELDSPKNCLWCGHRRAVAGKEFCSADCEVALLDAVPDVMCVHCGRRRVLGLPCVCSGAATLQEWR